MKNWVDILGRVTNNDAVDGKDIIRVTGETISVVTTEREQAIRNKLAEMPELAVGLGDEKSACSVAAINLALTGELTDTIPACMSEVVGWWIITVQDEMPAEIRNSKKWRELLPLAAGTGRERERERLEIILAWMWELLKGLQDHADKNGYGAEWRQMCEERTQEAIYVVIDAAAIAPVCVVSAYNTIDAYLDAAAASAAYAVATCAKNWDAVNPCGLLERLI